MRLAVYPGSFDPVTNGHLDIIERAAQLFDIVIVAVSKNAGKNPLFTVEERMEMLNKVLAGIPNVRVDAFDGLTVKYIDKVEAHAIIRGLRAISDFENEFQMALTNKKLNPRAETVFMMAQANFSFLSSSVVKEVASFGGCVAEFVPPYVVARLRDKFGENL